MKRKDFLRAIAGTLCFAALPVTVVKGTKPVEKEEPAIKETPMNHDIQWIYVTGTYTYSLPSIKPKRQQPFIPKNTYRDRSPKINFNRYFQKKRR